MTEHTNWPGMGNEELAGMLADLLEHGPQLSDKQAGAVREAMHRLDELGDEETEDE